MSFVRKNILIVDDEEDLTWSLSRGLRKDEDIFEVICVNSGEEALAVLSSLRMDLVISDIRLPQMDGIALIKYIRATDPDCQIIMMTACGSDQIRDEAKALGTAYFIEKPFEIRFLRKLIYEAIASSDEKFERLLASGRFRDVTEFSREAERTHTLHV